MIELTVSQAQFDKTVQRAREREIFLPTFAMMKNPELASLTRDYILAEEERKLTQGRNVHLSLIRLKNGRSAK